jgi:hypothetical protein
VPLRLCKQIVTEFNVCSHVYKNTPSVFGVSILRKQFITNLEADDTWHAALGLPTRMSNPWLLNFGVAYYFSWTF